MPRVGTRRPVKAFPARDRFCSDFRGMSVLNLRSPARPSRSRAMETTEDVAGSQTTP